MEGTAPAKTLPELQGEHNPGPRRRHADPRTGEELEAAGWRNYVRDLILGFNDGVVSVYALVAGIAGAGFDSRGVAIAGIAAAVAGALSMGIGEYLSTKSQAEYYAAEARRERQHIQAYPELEKTELSDMLRERGYPDHLVAQLVTHIASDEKRFVDFMMREEFGVGDESSRSPGYAALVIMVAFLCGSFLPVVMFLMPVGHQLVAASLLSFLGLFAAGAAKARVSGLSIWRSGLEMGLLGAVAAAITYGIGYAIDLQLH